MDWEFLKEFLQISTDFREKSLKASLPLKFSIQTFMKSPSRKFLAMPLISLLSCIQAQKFFLDSWIVSTPC